MIENNNYWLLKLFTEIKVDPGVDPGILKSGDPISEF